MPAQHVTEQDGNVADMTNRPLTERQTQVLGLLCRGWIVGRPLTYRQVGEALGVKSTNSVNAHFTALERRGLLERLSPARAHAPIAILPEGWRAWGATYFQAPELGPEEATRLAYDLAAWARLGRNSDVLSDDDALRQLPFEKLRLRAESAERQLLEATETNHVRLDALARAKDEITALRHQLLELTSRLPDGAPRSDHAFIDDDGPAYRSF